jgi:hypothetical protein
MTFEQPPRLKHSAEFGPLLRAAEPAITVERLATNASAVKTSIAAGATTFALWKLLAPFVLLLAVAVPVIVRSTRDTPAHERVAETPPPVATNDAVVPIDALEIAVAIDADVVVAEDAAPSRRVAVARPPEAAPDAAVEAPSATSDLPEQIRIYEAARAAGRRGELERGLALIDELVTRFPATQLRAEAELTRAELLARANRVGVAAPALEILIADPVHRGRRGELLRTLGDLYRRNGDCAHAVDAYTRALAERLAGRDRADIERSRDRCAGKTK